MNPKTPPQPQLTQQQFEALLTQLAEKYAVSIDQAMTKTSLEYLKMDPRVLESSQTSALLIVAARRAIRAGLPDMAIFTVLREALNGARKEIEAMNASAPQPASGDAR